MSIRTAFAVFVLVFCLSIGSAEAQDHGNSLDNYTPPPMFDDGGGVKKFPLEVKTINNSVDPNQPAHEPTNTMAADGMPPLPKRRPEKFKASPELMKQVLSRQQGVNDDSLEITRIKPEAGDAQDITSDPLENLLANPSAKEVLAALDGEAPKRQQIRDITTRVQANKTPMKMVAVRPVRELPQTETKRTETPPEQVAMSQPETIEKNALVISLFFDGQISELSASDLQLIETKALPMLKARPDLRVQVQAFAAPHDEGQNAARRLSLSRAISIRSYLVERDVDPGRIDLRALGSQTEIEPADRADILLVEKGKML
jgi:outer membrane protein OmpA-like peptidoglycan-associated protein